MVGVLDYGMGNLHSVCNALETLGADVKLCRRPEELREVERLIMPGVGTFDRCMANLSQDGLIEAVRESVLSEGKPIFGICLGMQVMAKRGFENGDHDGLGWIDAEVVRLQPKDSTLRVPHVGWDNIEWRDDSAMFKGLPPGPEFYFVHSYHLQCTNSSESDATCDYGGRVTVAIRKGNIFGTQFHPEKSQDYGLGVLSNFLKWRP
ncbi:MAG TPA: imidazole glycerol phosphate synthase subunit HisH [Candidatus Acidoferrum sp.]|nr:imidazole glycerol phosphate synthase subunit HisH [Candidatus Acidoferrum sp.]